MPDTYHLPDTVVEAAEQIEKAIKARDAKEEAEYERALKSIDLDLVLDALYKGWA
jgi:hypothetical protein